MTFEEDNCILYCMQILFLIREDLEIVSERIILGIEILKKKLAQMFSCTWGMLAYFYLFFLVSITYMLPRDFEML